MCTGEYRECIQRATGWETLVVVSVASSALTLCNVRPSLLLDERERERERGGFLSASGDHGGNMFPSGKKELDSMTALTP